MSYSVEEPNNNDIKSNKGHTQPSLNDWDNRLNADICLNNQLVAVPEFPENELANFPMTTKTRKVSAGAFPTTMLPIGGGACFSRSKTSVDYKALDAMLLNQAQRFKLYEKTSSDANEVCVIWV